MPFGANGTFTLINRFGTGDQPNFQFPPKVGEDLDDFTVALSSIKTGVSIVQTDHTLVLSDAQKCLLAQGTLGTKTITIPSFASVSLGQSTVIQFANFGNASWVITPAASVTQLFSPGGSTTSRTVAVAGVATMLALFDDTWVIYGTGIT
jgi:hypothetical protein